jgi:glucose/arabinose dehydrogenase
MIGPRRALLALVAAVVVVSGSACDNQTATTGRPAPPTRQTVQARTATASSRAPSAPKPHRALRAVVVTRNLDVPWGIAFLPGGGILVGERDSAKIVLVHRDGSKRLVKTVRGVHSNGAEGGEAGLLGLTLSPHFRTDHFVYAYMSGATDNRVVRMRWRQHSLGRKQVIFSGIPRGLHHNGGRIAFGPDGMLYVTTGEAEVPARAQHKRSLGGKILRMTPQGTPAPGNPFHHSVVWSYGHRNVEGLDWDPAGRLWATEFGDHAYDELNLIRPGHNYGWPIVEGRSNDARFTNPKTVWLTDHAGPSGIAITRLRRQTVAFIGALTGGRLWRVVLHGSSVASKRPLYVGRYGRIRTTAVARGSLWFTTSNTDGRTTPRPGDDMLIRVPLS